MDRRTLEQLRRVAAAREERAAAELRAAQRRLAHGQQMHRQLEAFGTEYRQAGQDRARSGGSAAYMADALAFGQRLQATAGEHARQLDFHEHARAAAQQQLVRASQRSGLADKLLSRAVRREQAEAERREWLEIEESIAARHVARKLR